MRTFLCLSCGEVYEEVVENKEYVLGNSYGSNMYPCPKVNCCGIVIEIDEFLVSSIRNLSNLGFNTLACCSGHSHDDSVKYSNDVRTYILFDRSLEGDYISDEELELIRNSLPEGFIIETDSYDEMDRFTISKTCDCENESESFIKIGSNCSELLKWIEEVLPEIVRNFYEGVNKFDILNKSNESEFIGELESEDSDSPDVMVL